MLHVRSSNVRPASDASVSFAEFFSALAKRVSFAQGLIVSTFARGELQIVQPAEVPDNLLNGYSRGFHSEDRATWEAILTNKPVAGSAAWRTAGGYEQSSFLTGFLSPLGFGHIAAAPLAGPLLRGYPGALQLIRKAGEPDFSQADLQALEAAAQELDRLMEDRHTERWGAACADMGGWRTMPGSRYFVYEPSGSLIAPLDTQGADERLLEQMASHARNRLGSMNGDAVTVDRVQFPDAHGDLWNVCAANFRSYPALSAKPVSIFCLQPDPCEWSTVQPADVQADPELSRLIPTVQFMQEEFDKNPTLQDIASKAHLSPFHFHRRFTELLGLTPKQFLTGCQVHRAKTMLLERQKDLATIARECGFAHQSHFTSRFKQTTGLTPTRWRKLAVDVLQTANN